MGDPVLLLFEACMMMLAVSVWTPTALLPVASECGHDILELVAFALALSLSQVASQFRRISGKLIHQTHIWGLYTCQ